MVRDAKTGQILAQGMQQAGTGDTDLIMRKPRVRGATVFGTLDASGFLAVINLERPTVVEVTAEGTSRQSAGDPARLENIAAGSGSGCSGRGSPAGDSRLPIVKPVSPQLDAKIKAESPLEVRATVTMSCGCPIEPGGLWDANKIHVMARVIREGKIEAEVPMQYAGVQNTFAGNVSVNAPGRVELQVLAMDPGNANFGLNRQDFTVIP